MNQVTEKLAKIEASIIDGGDVKKFDGRALKKNSSGEYLRDEAGVTYWTTDKSTGQKIWWIITEASALKTVTAEMFDRDDTTGPGVYQDSVAVRITTPK